MTRVFVLLDREIRIHKDLIEPAQMEVKQRRPWESLGPFCVFMVREFGVGPYILPLL